MKRLIVLLAILFLAGCCPDYTLKGYPYDREVYLSLFKKQIEKKDKQLEKMPGYLGIRIYNDRYLPTLSRNENENEKK